MENIALQSATFGLLQSRSSFMHGQRSLGLLLAKLGKGNEKELSTLTKHDSPLSGRTMRYKYAKADSEGLNRAVRTSYVDSIDKYLKFESLAPHLYEVLANGCKFRFHDSIIGPLVMHNESGNYLHAFFSGSPQKLHKSYFNKGLKYVVTIDILSMFNSVTPNTLISALALQGIKIDHDLLRTTCGFIEHGIPYMYGTTSQIVASLIMSLIDSSLLERRKSYTRTQDDILVFCNDYSESVETRDFLLALLSQLGLRSNPNKTCILRPERSKYLEIGINAGSLPLENYEFENDIENFETRYGEQFSELGYADPSASKFHSTKLDEQLAEWFDWEGLRHDYLEPGRASPSKAVEDLAIRLKVLLPKEELIEMRPNVIQTFAGTQEGNEVIDLASHIQHDQLRITESLAICNSSETIDSLQHIEDSIKNAAQIWDLKAIAFDIARNREIDINFLQYGYVEGDNLCTTASIANYCLMQNNSYGDQGLRIIKDEHPCGGLICELLAS